jgi:hypothetical protein
LHKQARLEGGLPHVQPFRFATERRSERIRQLQAEKEAEAAREAARRSTTAAPPGLRPALAMPLATLSVAALEMRRASTGGNLRAKLELAPAATVPRGFSFQSEERSQ